MWVDKKDENQNQLQDTDQIKDQSIGAGAGSAPIQASTTPATGTMSSTNPAPATPTQKFGSIQDYFKANRQQGEQLGEKFASQLDTTKQQNQQQIGQAAEAAKGQIQTGTTGFDENLTSQAIKDPTKVAGDEGQFNKFMQQWGASYKGPQSFEQSSEYEKAIKAANEAKSKAEQAKTIGGRQQLIQDQFGVYGTGNKSLDEALIQQSSQFGKIGEKAKELGSLQDYLTAKSKEVGTEAQKAKETTEQTKQRTREALLGEAGAATQFKTDLDTRVRNAMEKSGIADQYKAHLKTGDIGAIHQDLMKMGLSAADQDAIILRLKTLQDQYGMNVDLGNYYTANPRTDVTPSSVATQEDYNKSAALQKLTGGEFTSPLNPADIAQANTWDTANTGLNTMGLSQYLKDKVVQQDTNLLNDPQPLQKALTPTRDANGNIVQPNQATKDTVLNKYESALLRAGWKPGDTVVPGIKNNAKEIIDILNKERGGKLKTSLPEQGPITPEQRSAKISQLEQQMEALRKTTKNKAVLDAALAAYQKQIDDLKKPIATVR